MPDLFKEVPDVLRGWISEPAVLTSLLPNYLQDVDLVDAIRFIEGAMDHQEQLRNEEDNRWFTIEKLESVEIIERTSGDWVLGEKARLHFRDKAWKSDKIVDQHIDTGWISFNGFNKENFAWEIALANTIREIAEDAVGKKIYVQKIMYTTEDDQPARYVGNIRVAPDSQQDDTSDRKSRRSSGGKSGKRQKSEPEEEPEDDGEDHTEEIEKQVEKIDTDGLLQDEDVHLLADVFADYDDVSDDVIEDEIAEYLDIEEVTVPRRLRDQSQIRRAIKYLISNLEAIEEEDEDE